MKRIGILLLTLFSLFLLSGCAGSDTNLHRIGETLGISVDAGTVQTENDTHGGFPADGTTFEIIAFPDSSVQHEIEQSADWLPLPMDDTAAALIDGIETDTASVGPFLTNDNGDPLIPQVQNGWYWIRDRHPDSKDKTVSPELLERESINVTVAVYDRDANRLYYCALDT